MIQASKQLVVACLVGAVLGWGGHAWYAPDIQHRRGEGSRGEPEHLRNKMLERFTTRLHLTLAQQRRVTVILEEKRSRIDALRAEMRPKFEEIRSATRAEIRQILTPAQQKEFDSMIAEHEAREKTFRERWGGGEAAEEQGGTHHD